MNMRRGYTLIELAMIVTIVAIIFAVTLPSTGVKENEEGNLAGQNFEVDVSYARSYSIAHPEDPVLIKMDQANNQYWLAKQSAPDTPIAHPQTGAPYLIKYGTGGRVGFEHVQITAYDFGGDTSVKFDSTGGLDQSTTAILQLTSANSKYEVDVSPAAAQATVQKGFIANISTDSSGVVTAQ